MEPRARALHSHMSNEQRDNKSEPVIEGGAHDEYDWCVTEWDDRPLRGFALVPANPNQRAVDCPDLPDRPLLEVRTRLGWVDDLGDQHVRFDRDEVHLMLDLLEGRAVEGARDDAPRVYAGPAHPNQERDEAAWTRGFAQALVEVHRREKNSSVVVEVARAAGLTMEKIRRSGVDQDFELSELNLAGIQPDRAKPVVASSDADVRPVDWSGVVDEANQISRVCRDIWFVAPEARDVFHYKIGQICESLDRIVARIQIAPADVRSPVDVGAPKKKVTPADLHWDHAEEAASRVRSAAEREDRAGVVAAMGAICDALHVQCSVARE